MNVESVSTSRALKGAFRVVLSKVLQRKQVDDSWHIEFITSLAKALKPRVYVEIGIYRCSTLNSVANFAEHSFGFDIDPEAGTYVSHRATFVLGSLPEKHYLLQAHTHQVDLVFIDGDHRSEKVFDDFVAVLPYLSPNALVLIHDSWPMSKEFIEDRFCSDSFRVPELLQERIEGRFETWTFRVHPGLTFVQRVETARPWEH